MHAVRSARQQYAGAHEKSHRRGRRVARRGSALVCLACVAPAFAQEGAPLADHSVLTAEGLVAEVLQRNPSLESQRAAMSAAAARIKTAGALDDPSR